MAKWKTYEQYEAYLAYCEATRELYERTDGSEATYQRLLAAVLEAERVMVQLQDAYCIAIGAYCTLPDNYFVNVAECDDALCDALDRAYECHVAALEGRAVRS